MSDARSRLLRLQSESELRDLAPKLGPGGRAKVLVHQQHYRWDVRVHVVSIFADLIEQFDGAIPNDALEMQKQIAAYTEALPIWLADDSSDLGIVFEADNLLEETDNELTQMAPNMTWRYVITEFGKTDLVSTTYEEVCRRMHVIGVEEPIIGGCYASINPDIVNCVTRVGNHLLQSGQFSSVLTHTQAVLRVDP